MGSAVHWLTATELAAGFATQSLTPSLVLDAVLARIAARNEHIGAVLDLDELVTLRAAAAASEARWSRGAPRSPLDGVPFAVKANIAVAGLPWHAGIAAYRDRRAQEDSAAVAALRAAGLVALGTLNMHEAALGETTQNPAFLNTVNPWAPAHIAGGSSGGSAAAVAGGLLPLALGTDNMGSVRLPSALCGVVGYKPAHGVVPVAGVVPLSPSLDHLGVHARSVADVAAVMTIFGEDESGDLSLAAAGFRPGRVQLPEALAVDSAISACCEARLAAAGLAADDARWVTADWRAADLARERRAGLLRCERDADQVHRATLADDPDGFSDLFQQLVSWGASQTDAKAAAAEATIAAAVSRLAQALDCCDLLLLPTAPALAPRIDESPPLTLADLTATAAFAGLPAVSVPAGLARAPDGARLPVGLQVIGRDPAMVLAGAAQVAAPFEAPPENA